MKFSQLELEKVACLMDAANFAALQHQYLRRSGYNLLPYINHLLKVTQVLIEVEGENDLYTLQASLLHDVLEDTSITAEELSQKFSPEVATIVEELTDNMELPYVERKRLQIEGAKHLSGPAQKIRIADKGSNILDMLYYPVQWTRKRKVIYVEFAGEVLNELRGRHPKLEKWLDGVLKQAKSELEIL